MITKKIRRITVSDVVRNLLLAWLLAVMAEYLLLPDGLRRLTDLKGVAQMSPVRVAGLTLVALAVLSSLSLFRDTKTAGRWCIVVIFGVLAAVSLRASFTWAYFGVCVLLFVLLTAYAIWGWNGSAESVCPRKKDRKVYGVTLAAVAALFFLFVSAWTVGRVYSFCTPTYDFGIFSQMFHSMKTTGTPITTVERDGALSHFAVHVSPIYYLWLPVYCLFPVPATLQVLQAAVMASSVIPLWKLGKHHGLKGLQSLLVCVALLLFPAFSGGASYDVHENCFLTPVILWLLYSIEKKRVPWIFVFAILTLMVKEDAAVYVAVVALWLIVSTLLKFQKEDWKRLLTGFVLLGLALGWFVLVTGFLARQGDGVMTYRYNNFMFDGSSSLFTVIKSVLLNPMKALFECVDSEKLYFIALTMGPLLMIPLWTRRYERYILLIPYVLVNLMSDYRYQHDIFFQYTFGANALLLYLTVVNLADLKKGWKRTILSVIAVLACAACFALVVIPKAVPYPVQAVRYYDHYRSIRNALDTIPEEASVAATTFHTTHLSARETLYDIRYCSKAHLLEADYVVLKLNTADDYKKYGSYGKQNGFEALVALLESRGYVRCETVEGVLIIYKK